MTHQDRAGPSSSSSPPRHGAGGPFSEEQFLAVGREVGRGRARPGSSWELLADSPGVRIYRVPDQKSGLYEYKVYGDIADCSPELCAEVYMDLNYRPAWDPYAKAQYVFIRERRDLKIDGRKLLIILAKSVSSPHFPEKSGVIRVTNFKQSVAIESDDTNGSRVYMSYFDDPGGMVPSWFVNWASKTAAPNFLKDMKKACLSYHKKR